MATCLTIETGGKLTYTFQPLVRGDCNKPPEITITTSAEAPADGNAASITVTALPAGTSLPAGMWLDFVTSTGKIIPVKLTANAIAAATSLAVANVPEVIPSGSTCELPAFLTGRESASLGRSGDSEDVQLLDLFWANRVTTGASWDVSADGIYVQLSAAYRNLEFCFENGLNGWVQIIFPSPNPLVYSTGVIYEGEVTVQDLPIDITKGVVKGNATLNGNGQLYKIEPKPIAANVP